MAYQISDLENDLTGILHGTTLNKVTNKFPLYNRAARKLLEDIDPIETVRITELTNALYDKVYDYASPADLKGDRIIDIRPQVNRTLQDRFFQVYNQNFDLEKYRINNRGEVTVQWNTAVKSLRIVKPFPAGILLSGCDQITGTPDGTWAATANATDLFLDTLNYVQGNASLRFNMSAAGSSGYLENSTIQSMDISTYENMGAIFLYVYIPNITAATSFNLRWGTNSTNYWSRTVTSAQNSTAFQVGWNLLRYDWEDATVTGSPDSADFKYLRFTCNYNGTAFDDMRLDNIALKMGSIYQIEYYSKFLFRDSTGVFKENATTTTDLLNLDTDSFNLYVNLVSFYMAQQVQGADAGFDASFFLNEYNTGKSRYVAKNRSQTIVVQETYYNMPAKQRPVRRWRS